MDVPDPKRCLGCDYILEGLPAPRCPECGRGFDPNDPSTYRSRTTRGRTPWPVMITAIPAAAAVAWLGGMEAAGLLYENPALPIFAAAASLYALMFSWYALCNPLSTPRARRAGLAVFWLSTVVLLTLAVLLYMAFSFVSFLHSGRFSVPFM